MMFIREPFRKLLKTVQGKPEEMVISTVMLRSMQQAKYDPESLGHFGLSTSFIPILLRLFDVILIHCSSFNSDIFN